MMPEYQQRVVNERDDLSDKLSKLAEFLGSDMFYTLSESEQGRLKRQHIAMSSYFFVLNERIEAFSA